MCEKCEIRKKLGYVFCDECGAKVSEDSNITFKPCPGMYKYKGE